MQLNISPIRIAARAGILVGILLVIRFLCLAYSFTHPYLIIPFLAFSLFLPYLIYRYIKSFRDIVAPNSPFSWNQGFSFGFFLMFFATIFVLIPRYYFYSTLLHEQFPLLISSIETSSKELGNSLGELTHLIKEVYKEYSHTPIHILLLNDWMGSVFWGAIISALSALFIRRK